MTLKKSILRILTSVLLVASVMGSTLFVASAEETDKSGTTTTAAESISVNDGSYSSYYPLYEDAEKTDEDAVCKLSNVVLNTNPIDFEVTVQKSGIYYIGMEYKALDSQKSDFTVGIKIDGEYPYIEAEEFEFPRMWRDEESEHLYDDSGNQYAPQQVQYEGFFYNEAIDDTSENGDRYTVYLTAGTHKVTIVPVDANIEITQFKFSSTALPDAYTAPTSADEYYDGETITIEGEDAKVKSSYFFVGQSNASSTLLSPQSPEVSLINYIGGGNWSGVGETLVWEVEITKAGYYNLGYTFQQNSVVGSKTYRTLKIDGEVPFAEANQIGFEYDTDWQQAMFADKDGTPYLIYLQEGKHEISLSVTAGEIGEVRKLLSDAVAEMGDLYVDITKITGETVDTYRDYELFKQVPNMEERLLAVREKLEESGKLILEITGATSGDNYSVVQNMILAIDKMLDNKYEAHRQKDYFYTNYCSVSSVLQDLTSMPLSLDKMILSSPENQEPFDTPSFFENLSFSTKRFFVSFIKDYNSVSSSDGAEKSITIWVNWGRDQAQVLSSMIDRSFTPKTGIAVNLKLVNASVIQAVLSGNGPDCFLMHARSEPVNLAMRGVLYDLTQFDDYEQVLERFQDSASTPYWYKGGLYGLPDTQTFFVMFYRTDILQEYGIEVPETWEEFDLAAKLLMRNNMSVWLPNTQTTDPATNGGVGITNIFPSLLLQNNIPLYAENGQKTNLLSSEAMVVFEKWTSYYSDMNFPKTLDFYNRFRVGTTPLGIASYATYNTLKVAAPEIEDLWGFTAIPGTVQEDGTVKHASAGGGTACSLLKASKDPESAWEFLKWWTDTDTQLTYSNNIESILGPTGRVALSNVEALKALDWEDEHLDSLLNAWEEVEEINEYPGSYYVSRSIYQAYWNVVNANKNSKDMLMKFGKEADDEITRKWKQYDNR